MFASILRQTSPTATAPNAPKSSWKRRLAIPGVRVLAKTSAGQEAYFEQNDPHPDPPVRREREQADFQRGRVCHYPLSIGETMKTKYIPDGYHTATPYLIV